MKLIWRPADLLLVLLLLAAMAFTALRGLVSAGDQRIQLQAAARLTHAEWFVQRVWSI